MSDTSRTRITGSSGKFSSGYLKISWLVLCDASSTVRRNKKNTREYSTIEKQSGVLSWNYQSRIFSKRRLDSSKKLKCKATVKTTISHRVNCVLYQKAIPLGQLWHSIESYPTRKIWPLTKNWMLHTWCWRISSQRCSSINSALQSSTMMTSWKSTRDSSRSGRKWTNHSSISLLWISRNAMTM